MKIRVEAEGRFIEEEVDDGLIELVRKSGDRWTVMDFVAREIRPAIEGLLYEVLEK